MGRWGPVLLALVLATALVLDGRVIPLSVRQSRLVTGGTSLCSQEETQNPQVPAMRAAWWWLWQAWSRRVVRASGGEAAARRIVIDTGARRLYLYDGERLVKDYPVAVGKPRTPTPPGEWRIVSKSRNWGGGFGTRWLGLNVPWGIYGIHGTNKPYSIGSYASAGCVRMFNRDVEDLFERVAVGTPVTILGPLPSVTARDRIAPGTSGKAVLVLQVRLRQAGFDAGRVDGRFGPATERRIRELQAFYGFPVTGELTRDQQALIGFPR